MINCSKRNLVAITTIAFVLALPSATFAGGKGGGGGGVGNHPVSVDKPKESMSLNYTKIEHEYKPQKPDGTASSKKTGTTKGKRQEYMRYEMNNVYISR